MNKNKIFITLMMCSSLAWATGTDGGSSGGSTANSINSNLDQTRIANNGGASANNTGAIIHQGIATAAMMKFYATCSKKCQYPYLALAIANQIMGAKANQQANNHIGSNLGLMPDLCATASGFCNPTNPLDPTSPGPGPTGSCPISDTMCTSCDIRSPSCKPTEVGKLPPEMVKACGNNVQCKNGIIDPKTGKFKLNDKEFSVSDFKDEKDLKEKLGLSDSDLSQLKNDISQANTGADAAMAEALAAAGLDKAKTATASSSGVGLDGLGSFGGSFSSGSPDKEALAEADAAARALKDKALKDRVPANVAGLTKNFKGEPIGVAEDNIFAMMNRRYQTKDKQNSFLDPAVAAP